MTHAFCCPKCKHYNTLSVHVLVQAKLVQDITAGDMETVIDSSDHEWDENYTMLCGCGHSGPAKEFAVEVVQETDDADIAPGDKEAWAKVDAWLQSNKFGMADGIGFETYFGSSAHEGEGLLVPVYGNVIVPKSVYRTPK